MRGFWTGKKNKTSSILQGEIIYPPPPPSIVAQKALLGAEGGGGNFEAPHGWSFKSPPLLYAPPPLEGYFQAWGGVGVYTVWPPMFTLSREGIGLSQCGLFMVLAAHICVERGSTAAGHICISWAFSLGLLGQWSVRLAHSSHLNVQNAA